MRSQKDFSLLLILIEQVLAVQFGPGCIVTANDSSMLDLGVLSMSALSGPW